MCYKKIQGGVKWSVRDKLKSTTVFYLREVILYSPLGLVQSRRYFTCWLLDVSLGLPQRIRNIDPPPPREKRGGFWLFCKTSASITWLGRIITITTTDIQGRQRRKRVVFLRRWPISLDWPIIRLETAVASINESQRIKWDYSSVL